MNSKDVLTILIIWFLLTLLFACLGLAALDWRRLDRLSGYDNVAEGRVTAKEPGNHQLVRYSYQAGQRAYSGSGNAGGVNPPFDRLNIGDRVTVFYNPQDPSESFLGDPKEHVSSLKAGVIFLAVVGPLFSLAGLYAKGWLPISKRGRA
jgi:hypothetical protein